jgi:hypothetical protein
MTADLAAALGRIAVSDLGDTSAEALDRLG